MMIDIMMKVGMTDDADGFDILMQPFDYLRELVSESHFDVSAYCNHF